ncbi:MAG: efflux RND transporter permease subunit [Desulfobulbaceae bacterium]|nr:efflux RND transporter permease subunit [Desulfobulbaceae bacterium]
MIVSDTAVDKSTTVLVLCIILIIFGVYCYKVLPRESSPDITIPYVFVSTDYRGVSPSDIETSVTMELEKRLKGVEGVKKIRSLSSQGLSSISIEFVTGTDIDKALQDVKDKVDEAGGDLPNDLEDDPSVFEVNISEMPIVIFSLSGPGGLAALKEIADDLEDDIEGITGVLEVDVTGGLEREIRVEVIPEKLAYYKIPITSLRDKVYNENQNTSGGAIRMGDGRFQLRVPGEFRSPDEIYGLVVGTHQGAPVYLKDVAVVVDGYKDELSRSRLDGHPSINISVKKRTGENITSICNAIDQVIESKQSLWPVGTSIIKVMDQAKDIEMMVADLENNIMSGLVLVVVVLFFAMGLRNAFLVSLAIPFSMFLSFVALYLLGITLNMVVLFSLTLALGMLVDNAIVIVENVYRYMEQGVPRVTAAKKASSEVAYPVICSTLTTLAAFSPMMFWPGIMGEFMGFLPLTLIITLTSSLFTALVINPALASIFMSVGQYSSSCELMSADQVLTAGEKPVEIKGSVLMIYERMIRYSLDRPLGIMALAVCVLVFLVEGWLLVVGIENPVEFFPEIDPKTMYVNVDVPEGADIEYIDKIMKRIEMAIGGSLSQSTFGNRDDMFYDLPPQEHQTAEGEMVIGPSDLGNIKNIYMKAVSSSGGAMAFDANAPNHVGVRFLDLEQRNQSSKVTLEEVRRRVQSLAGGIITVAAQKEGPPTGAPINIEISGDDLSVLGRLAKEVRDTLAKSPYVKDIRDDYVEGSPTVKVVVDRQRAALFGLSTDAIGFALKTVYNGLDVSSYRQGDDDFDITVRLSEKDRRVTDVLRQFLIPTPSGVMVPLSTLTRVEFGGDPGDIVRINNKRTVTVKADVDETKVSGAVARAQAEEVFSKAPLPPGYALMFTGENQEQQEAEEFLGRAFLVACLFIFLILVAQFNSVSQPFIIMTSVILSLGGAFLGLALFRQPFGVVMTGVGVISLAGVVVNNAIVLVDYINKLRERGMSLREAVVAGGATRLRPVILTAVTTILGLIPMVTGVSFDFRNLAISWASESSQWWQSMAVVVIFGLVVATFLTLVVVPTLYMLFGRLTEKGS